MSSNKIILNFNNPNLKILFPLKSRSNYSNRKKEIKKKHLEMLSRQLNQNTSTANVCKNENLNFLRYIIF